MIDLYYWTTPNGHKITIFLEEAGLAYRIIAIAARFDSPSVWRPRHSPSTLRLCA
jgi:glutathione S-transferase